MRCLTFALALAAAPATGQSLWRTEFGVQGGYLRRYLAGGTTAYDRADIYELPLTGQTDGNLSPGSIFAIVPLGGRLALEPSFAVFLSTPPSYSGTTVTLGLRADYAFTSHIYVAAGGEVARVNGAFFGSAGMRGTLLGLEAAAGYRVRLTSRLRGRIEANVLTVATNGLIQYRPFNLYGVLVGISSGAAERTPASTRRPDVWAPTLGIQGGYTRTDAGYSAFSLLTFPSVGAAGIRAMVGPQPPAFFAIIPVNGRLAIEPIVDLHQAEGGGPSCVNDQVGARVDYGFGAWYGAVGGTVHAEKCFPLGPKDLAGILGAGIAWGYRFALPEELEGRVELGYSATKERRDVPYAVRTISLMVGLMTPLN